MPKAKPCHSSGRSPPRQHLGVHHAGAQDLQPVVALAHLHRAAFPGTLDVDLGRGFREREVRGAEAGPDLRAEIGREELLQRPFQVRHGDVAVDGQPLDLVEHRRVRLVVIGAVDAARRDHAAGGAVGLHMADLHRAGVGAQHVRAGGYRPPARCHVERVHLGPRGVVAGDVQRVEIVPIGLDLRPLGHGEAHVGEDRGDLLGHLAHRVDRAHGAGAARAA
jgi:hypothetical protein